MSSDVYRPCAHLHQPFQADAVLWRQRNWDVSGCCKYNSIFSMTSLHDTYFRIIDVQLNYWNPPGYWSVTDVLLNGLRWEQCEGQMLGNELGSMRCDLPSRLAQMLPSETWLDHWEAWQHLHRTACSSLPSLGQSAGEWARLLKARSTLEDF